MVGHGLHATLALSHQLGDRAEVFLGDINGHTFHGLAAHALDGLGDDLRLTNGEFEAFTAHLLNKNCQSEFATSLNFPCIGTLGGQDSNGNVTDQFAIQAILHLACGHLCALDSSSHGRSVNTDRHRDRGIINGDQGQGVRIVEVNQRLTNGDVFDAGYRNDIAGLSGFGRKALQAFGAQKLGDTNRLNRSVVASQTNSFTLTQSAVVDTQQGEAAKEGRGVEVRHVCLQGCAFLIFGAGNALKDRLEERLKILGGDIAVAGVGQRGFSCLCRGVDNGDIQQRVNISIHAFAHEVLSQCEKQVLGFRDNLIDTRIGTVNLIDNDHDGKLGLKGLAKDETSLRERSFRGIDKQNDAVNHG